MAESTEGKEERFRKLVLERDYWNLDLNIEFDFKTIYKLSEYSYKMCSCVFVNEFFREGP